MKRSNCRTGSMVNGIPAINFSERFNQLLIKDIATTVVFKLLGRSIEYTTLQNKINSLWRPSSPFQLMDIENRYFLVKFQNKDDFEKVLSQGPWIIYGQYLVVQSWTTDFNLMQPYPSVVKAWIRLSSLPDFFYKHRILEECNTPYPRPLPESSS
ncbi:hypothetical protein Gotri_024381, partial [Gossypium trilobum]|nr:hypothetical protein [Gossypium trilobum]